MAQKYIVKSFFKSETRNACLLPRFGCIITEYIVLGKGGRWRWLTRNESSRPSGAYIEVRIVLLFTLWTDTRKDCAGGAHSVPKFAIPSLHLADHWRISSTVCGSCGDPPLWRSSASPPWSSANIFEVFSEVEVAAFQGWKTPNSYSGSHQKLYAK